MGDLGFKGLEIGTHIEGEEISAPRLDPFWAEVERLAPSSSYTPGTTHPQRLHEHNFVNIIGHAYRGDPRTAHLIFAGVIERYPALKIVVVHGGGYLPAYAGRIDHGWRASEDVSEGVPRLPATTCAQFYFDTMVFEPDQLSFLVDKYGADHVAARHRLSLRHGRERPGRHWSARTPGLDRGAASCICGGNAARLMGLERDGERMSETHRPGGHRLRRPSGGYGPSWPGRPGRRAGSACATSTSDRSTPGRRHQGRLRHHRLRRAPGPTRGDGGDHRHRREPSTSSRSSPRSSSASRCSSRSRWRPTRSIRSRVLQAIEDAGIDAVIGYTQRFRRRFLTVKQRLRDGQIGEVTSVVTRAFMNRMVPIATLSQDRHCGPTSRRWWCRAPTASTCACG